MNRQPMKCKKKVFTMDTLNKGLTFRIYKEAKNPAGHGVVSAENSSTWEGKTVHP